MSEVSKHDKEILRVLGRELAEAAADPVNEVRKKIHSDVCGMKKGRPSIAIFQEPWNELNVNGELDLHCSDKFCQSIEQELRRTLYRACPKIANSLKINQIYSKNYW